MKNDGFLVAVSNVTTVIPIATSIAICASAVTPNTNIEPKKVANAIDHISDR